MKRKDNYDINVVMRVLEQLKDAQNVVVLYENDRILITADKDARKVELHISMYNPQIRDVLANRYNAEVTATCYVDNARAFGGLTIQPDDYEKVSIVVHNLSKMKQTSFDERQAWDFLHLDEVDNTLHERISH
jgi:hypothetical protein